jgi:hypothetical protein
VCLNASISVALIPGTTPNQQATRFLVCRAGCIFVEKTPCFGLFKNE